jgi:hypothetical protein
MIHVCSPSVYQLNVFLQNAVEQTYKIVMNGYTKNGKVTTRKSPSKANDEDPEVLEAESTLKPFHKALALR